MWLLKSYQFSTSYYFSICLWLWLSVYGYAFFDPFWANFRQMGAETFSKLSVKFILLLQDEVCSILTFRPLLIGIAIYRHSHSHRHIEK